MRHFLVRLSVSFLLVALGTDDFIQRRTVQTVKASYVALAEDGLLQRRSVRTLKASYVDLVDQYLALADEFSRMTESAQRFCEVVKREPVLGSSLDCNYKLGEVRASQAQLRKFRQTLPADWKGQDK